jgi:hypothetical protein
VFWNPEKKDCLEPEILSAARFIGNLSYGQLKNSRHADDWPTFIQFFAYEQRQNKIVDAQLRLADKISQRWGTPQAPRAMHQSSHRRGYARDATVASKRHLTLETLPCSACITQLSCFGVSGFHTNDRLFVDRYQ